MLWFLLACPPPSESADPAEFFNNSVIKLVVGYAPGGGYDTLARLIAPWLARETGATVIVDNRPGGGGLVALNQVVRARPDGLTLMLVNGRAAILSQILQLEGAGFDLMQAPCLARVDARPNVIQLSNRSRFRTLSDLIKSDAPIKWAAGSKIDNLADPVALLSETLVLRSEIIIGYKGSKEAALAAMRGEVDGIMISDTSASKSQDEILHVVAVLDRHRSTFLPDAPTLEEVVSLSPEQRWWFDFEFALAHIGRFLLTTPGAPPDRVEFLAECFRKILTNPVFLAEAKQQKLFIEHAPGAVLRDLLNTVAGSLTEDDLSRVRTVILTKYYR
jgi:tripartite-type tricarboxylate transporter receptor subunit TctC